jgi:hypothetical protein
MGCKIQSFLTLKELKETFQNQQILHKTTEDIWNNMLKKKLGSPTLQNYKLSVSRKTFRQISQIMPRLYFITYMTKLEKWWKEGVMSYICQAVSQNFTQAKKGKLQITSAEEPVTELIF